MPETPACRTRCVSEESLCQSRRLLTDLLTRRHEDHLLWAHRVPADDRNVSPRGIITAPTGEAGSLPSPAQPVEWPGRG
ncbi:hypothetical protein VULLAG_LOCUS11238 [Vulpes lagopus]